MAAFSIFSSSGEARANARAELEEKRNYHLAAKNQADDLGFKFKYQIEQDATNGVLSLFNNLIEKYTQISEKLNKDRQKNNLMKNEGILLNNVYIKDVFEYLNLVNNTKMKYYDDNLFLFFLSCDTLFYHYFQ